jgi:membrane-associated phospholipid phosphatase
MTPRERRFWTGAGVVTTEMIATLVIFTGAVAGLIFSIRPGMRRHKKTDLKIFDLVKARTNERNTKIMLAATALGKHQFLIPADLSLIFYFLFIRKHTWFSIRVAAIAISSLGLMFGLKYLFKRKRPLDPLLQKVKGMSFPSGHAIFAVTFYGLLIYIISQTLKDEPLKWSLIISLVVLIQLIGFSRVYLRVHYASDVAAGFIIGLAWLLIALGVLKRIEWYNKQQVQAASTP